MIRLLRFNNNFVEILKIISKKTSDILATSLSDLHNYFDSQKLF